LQAPERRITEQVTRLRSTTVPELQHGTQLSRTHQLATIQNTTTLAITQQLLAIHILHTLLKPLEVTLLLNTALTTRLTMRALLTKLEKGAASAEVTGTGLLIEMVHTL